MSSVQLADAVSQQHYVSLLPASPGLPALKYGCLYLPQRCSVLHLLHYVASQLNDASDECKGLLPTAYCIEHRGRRLQLEMTVGALYHSMGAEQVIELEYSLVACE